MLPSQRCLFSLESYFAPNKQKGICQENQQPEIFVKSEFAGSEMERMPDSQVSAGGEEQIFVEESRKLEFVYDIEGKSNAGESSRSFLLEIPEVVQRLSRDEGLCLVDELL